MKNRFLILVGLALLWAGPGQSGEVPVARVRGSVVTIEVGSDVGLAVGMEVSVVRPPGQTIVHPITGENLGAPAVEIGRGSISKVSAHAASVRLNGSPLMAVRPGDQVRFMTQEEELVREQERVVVTQQRNEQEHQEVRGEVARLAKGVKDVQGRIGALEGMMKRIERIEEGLRSQLRGINSDIAGMKGDIKELKELVSLYGPVPVSGLGEQKGITPPLPGAAGAVPTAAPVPAGAVPASGGLDLGTEEGRNVVRGIIRDELQQQQSLNASASAAAPPMPASAPPVESQSVALPAPAPVTTPPVPEPTPTVVESPPPQPAQTETPPDEDLTIPESPAKKSFWQETWFFGIIAGLGIIAIVAYLYVRMTSGNEEDEEDEEDEEEAEEEEVEVEEEEDDIVVEETS